MIGSRIMAVGDVHGQYEKLKKLIERSGDSVDFADFGDGISDEWITKAEEKLNITLPDSYKWWLRNYSGGEVDGIEIFSIYCEDFDTVVGGDIVYMYFQNKKLYDFPDTVLPICETDDDIYYFNTAEVNENSEYPIYSMNEDQLIANDFIDFLTKLISGEI